MTTADIVIPKSGTDIKFTYLIPEELEADPEIGNAVLAPFKNRILYGFIYDIRRDAVGPVENKKIKLKNIYRVSKPRFFDRYGSFLFKPMKP